MIGSRGITSKKAAWKEINKGRQERRSSTIKKNIKDRHD
jgi:hypothetical protein